MADSPGRVLLVKFRGDLRSLQGTMDDVLRAVGSMQRQLKTMQDKSHKATQDNTAKAIAGEKQQQTAVQTTVKAGEKKQTQESSLQAAISKTLAIRKQETLEISRQLSLYKELVASQSKAARNISAQLAQEISNRKTPSQGVIPVAVRTVSSTASAVGSLAQAAEAASYQQQLMRTMRLQANAEATRNAPGAGGAPNPLAASLAGGLAAPALSATEMAAMEQQRMRSLRTQNTATLTAVPSGAPMSKEEQREQKRQQAETERNQKKQAADAEKQQKQQSSGIARQQVLNADAQVRLIQNAEKQKQTLVMASNAAQRDAALVQLRHEEIDYSEYVSRVKVLIEQEKAYKLNAISAEEKALQHLLEVELATNKINQPTFQNESTVLSAKMGARRTVVEAASIRQNVAVSRQKPPAPKEDHENDSGEIFRGLGMGISKGLGGGLVGSIATGLLFGGGTLMVFDQAARGIESMIAKIKELVMETGPVQQLEAQFEHLSRAAGVDGPEFMGKLQTATHGLVGNMQLLQYATGALRSNLHLTDAQTIKFASDVSELARIQGKSVPQALAMAQRGLTTGQTRGVATYLGINQRELGLNAAPRYSTIQEREQLQQHQVQGAIENQISKSGPAPETMTEQIQRLEVAKQNFGEDFGQGLATSAGTKSFVTTLSRMADGINNLSEVAKKMGAALGDVFAVLGKMAEDVATMFSHLHGSLGSDQKNAWLTSVYENLTSIKGILFDIYATWRGLILGAKDLATIWGYLKSQSSVTNTASSVKAGASAFAANYSPTGEIITPIVKGMKAAYEAGKPENNKKPQTLEEMNNQLYSNKVEDDQALDELKETLSGGRLAGMKDRASALKKQINQAAPRPPIAGAGPETADLTAKRQQLVGLEAQIKKLQDEEDKGGGTGKIVPTMDPAARQLAIQMKEAEVKLTEDTEKEKLTIVEDSLDKQRDAQKIMLRDGETDMASYVDKMKGFVDQDKNAQLSKIDVITKAQLGLLETERRTGQIPQELYVAKAADVTKGSADQKAAVTREADKQTAALNDQLDQDKLTATKTNLNTELDIRKDALALQRSTIQHAYDEQLVDVKTYLDSERNVIEKTYDIEMQAAANKYKFNQSLAGQAEKHAEEIRAGSERNISLQQLNQRAPGLQIKYNQQQAQTAQDYIDQQQQLAIAQRGGAPLPVAQQRDYLSAKMSASSEEIQHQEELLTQLENEGQKYSTIWYGVSNAITAATEKIIQMRQEMLQLTNTSDKLLSGFSAIAQGLGSFPQGRTRGLSGVSAIPGILGAFTTAQQQAAPLDLSTPATLAAPDMTGANAGGAFMDTSSTSVGAPQSAIGGGLASIGTFLTDIFKNIKDLPDAFKNLGQSLTPVLGALGGAAQGIASGNAVEGAAGGAGLGGDIGKMFSKVSNIAGPIGSIAGAAFGGILSSIIGQKQQKAADMIHTMSLQFDQVMTTFKEGVIGMNEAINESEAIRNDLQAQMSSAGKKKRQQYQSALDAMNQQILALQAQQVQMIVQMQETLPTVGATPMTDFVNQLQQIVAQYTQFAGAARNASDLAQANEYLTQSLQGYAQTQLTSMTQAEQGAIQDAINLNDLYQQRQLLLQQMADQERDIMTQGILTRQTTTAQSKMEQIAVMKQQNELQLENMNEQISAATFRVDAEKQIFTLATTRIGLENQLLQMQNQGTLLDMARIAALQQVVLALQSGSFQSTLTNGLNTNNNNPGLQAFQNLLAALGIGNNDQGTSQSLDLEQMFLQLFNQNSSYNYGGFSIVNGGS